MGKENISGPNRVTGMRVITLTITEKVMELIINQIANFIVAFGREENIKLENYDQ